MPRQATAHARDGTPVDWRELLTGFFVITAVAGMERQGIFRAALLCIVVCAAHGGAASFLPACPAFCSAPQAPPANTFRPLLCSSAHAHEAGPERTQDSRGHTSEGLVQAELPAKTRQHECPVSRRALLRLVGAAVLASGPLPMHHAAASAEGSSKSAARESAAGPPFKKTASGLKFLDVVIGGGAEVEADSRVTFHYTGRLAGRQGKPFEDTYADEPVRIRLGEQGQTSCSEH